jgi:hypothetical protein
MPLTSASSSACRLSSSSLPGVPQQLRLTSPRQSGSVAAGAGAVDVAGDAQRGGRQDVQRGERLGAEGDDLARVVSSTRMAPAVPATPLGGYVTGQRLPGLPPFDSAWRITHVAFARVTVRVSG